MKATTILATVLLCLLVNADAQPSRAVLHQAKAASVGALKPGPASHMVYDTQRRQVVLLAASKQSEREEVWGWDGMLWQLIHGAGPAARELSGAVYDVRRKSIVLYGGIGLKPKEDRKGDTWEWDGKNWRQATDTSVGTRDHHAMAYDEARGKTVMFGGASSGASLASDTWEWDGVKWAQVATQGPGGRAHFAMVYDSVRKKVVLFGGIREDGKKYNDTWAWDGKIWQKLSDEGPPPRYHHRMAFDRQAGVIVLYGGLGAKQPHGALEDTWIWDGQQWKEVKTAGPGKRSDHVMAYDAARGKTVLFGGGSWDGKVSTQYDDTWEWDGKQWKQVNP
jgi:hypothetical protein